MAITRRCAESAAARKLLSTLSSAPWPQPAGLHMGPAERWLVEGGWNREWQRKRIPEPGALKGPTKWTIAFEEECAARGKRARRRCASTALRSIAPSTSTRSITRCAAPVPRGAGVTSGAHDIPPADEPHANRNSRVPGASSTRTGLSRARSTSMAPSDASQPCLEERIVQRVCRARGPGHLQVQGHGQV